MATINEQLSPEAFFLRLGRFPNGGDELQYYQAVSFPKKGRAGCEIMLRRSTISGRVEFEGEIENHICDVLSKDGEIIQTITLDQISFNYLKNKMRPKVDA